MRTIVRQHALGIGTIDIPPGGTGIVDTIPNIEGSGMGRFHRLVLAGNPDLSGIMLMSYTHGVGDDANRLDHLPWFTEVEASKWDIDGPHFLAEQLMMARMLFILHAQKISLEFRNESWKSCQVRAALIWLPVVDDAF